jgi:hypothetical protein
MDRSFHSAISVAVRQAKCRTSLLRADRLAAKIAEATPVPVYTAEIGEQVTR